MTADDPSTRAGRKDDHVRLAAQQRTEPPRRTEFDDVEFLHHALAGTDGGAVDLAVDVAGWRWNTPFYVNGMTGGTDITTRINRQLAIAARETGLPMACGSVSIALDDPAAAVGFRVIREENPDGFVMANLGAGRGGDDARRAVELLGADALQLHLNAVQETVMPEGSRDFSGWERSVESIVAASPVPVIVKEVGFGLSRRTLTRLAELGVRVADVSGTGGTDFMRIENSRRPGQDYAFLSGFGQSALACLLDAPADGPVLLASGGVRNPLDVVKALALGARAVGVAGVFLQAALADGADTLVPLIRGWLDQTAALCALLGVTEPAGLTSTDVLVRGRLGEFCMLRGVDAPALSQRSRTRRKP
ncbi:MAG: type 2 isopentenyl-diphosphate Delta-isomerase [Micropruina sp.]|nr:type 2 isopentenyl-diphosphate Delta-isomerase [Micropruina sp.]